MLIQSLKDKGLITPPKWLPDNTHYLTEMGSVAYGAATDLSDIDLYGFCIPPKEIVFPHLAGEIPGFGTQHKRFGQWQEHHIIDASANGGKGREYDFAVYSIVKYFQLCMSGRPNAIDSLFTPHDCVRHVTKIGQLVRDNRKLFLHKGLWHGYRGYAFSQLNKMSGKSKKSKRYGMIEKHGYDLKFAYHTIRLICEIEQILTIGDIDLRRDAELLKSIRRGEWTEERIRNWFTTKERDLEPLYISSKTVPYKPNEKAIKSLLLNCLEDHYGSLSEIVVSHDRHIVALRDIRDILDKAL